MKPPLSALRFVLTSFSRYLAIWVIVGATTAFFFPSAFAWTERTAFGEPIIKWMFALTMFAVGTLIDARDFAPLFRHPGAVVLGLLTQFTVMPTLAWLAARYGNFDDAIAVGLILVGCAPGAMTSNVLTHLARGDTAYSVTLTTVASVLAVVVTPTLIWLLAGTRIEITAEMYGQQLFTIAWTMAIPLLAGVAVRFLLGRLHRFFDACGAPLASAAIILIICFVVQKNTEALRVVKSSMGILVAVVVVNALGFLLGWILGRLYRFDRGRRVTLSIEIGMQNAGMGVVLAATTFQDIGVGDDLAVPAVLFAFWCILTGSVLIAFLKRREKPE